MAVLAWCVVSNCVLLSSGCVGMVSSTMCCCQVAVLAWCLQLCVAVKWLCWHGVFNYVLLSRGCVGVVSSTMCCYQVAVLAWCVVSVFVLLCVLCEPALLSSGCVLAEFPH